MFRKTNYIALGILVSSILSVIGGWAILDPEIKNNVDGQMEGYDSRFKAGLVVNVPEGRRSINLWNGCDEFNRPMTKIYSQEEAPGIGILFSGKGYWEFNTIKAGTCETSTD